MGNEQSVLDREAEEAGQRADADIDRIVAIEKEKSLARYREMMEEKQRRLNAEAAEESVGPEELEDGEVASEPEPIPVPIRSVTSPQSMPNTTDLLNSFKPRKEKEVVNRVSAKAGTSEDEYLGFGNELRSQSERGGIKNELPELVTKANDRDGSKTSTGINLSKTKTITDTSPTTSSKRPAPANASTDARKPSISSLPKIQKRTSNASPQSPDADRGKELPAIGHERPPRWYKDMPKPKSRDKNQSNADTTLSSLKTLMDKCKKSNFAQDRSLRDKTYADIRTKLHILVFCEVTGPLLVSHRMLHDDSGLPQIFERRYSNGIDWPFDIRADAKELYNKWCRRIFETDILRGIRFQVPTSGGKKDGKDRYTDSLDPKYKGAVSAKYHGNGDLLNGQWWPLQLCALRDGAHGASQGGISGAHEEGAYSCIMSGGHDYPDIDEGEEVWYCGTDSDNGAITEYTQRMLESVNNEPIRLIRSHNLESEYAPVIGFRYGKLPI